MAGPPWPGPGDVDRVEVARPDRAVQVRVDEVEPGRRAEVAEQARLHVLRLQRLAQQRVVEQVDLARRRGSWPRASRRRASRSSSRQVARLTLALSVIGRCADRRPPSRGCGSSGGRGPAPRRIGRAARAGRSLLGAGDLLGDAGHDHAPARSTGRVEVVDLEGRLGGERERRELRPARRAEHDRLRALVEGVVDGPDHRRPALDVDREPPEVVEASSRRHSSRSSSSSCVSGVLSGTSSPSGCRP